MEEDEKKHIEKIYKEKALKLLKFYMIIAIFSGLSYLIAIFLYKSFDFGLIFEIIAFVFIIIAYNKIEQSDFRLGKRNVIIAMFPIGWLIIYDLINLIANISEVLTEVIIYYTSIDQFFYFIEPYLYDVTLVASIILLYFTYSSLCKADGSKKADDYVESFYDKL